MISDRPVAIMVGYVVRYPLGGMTWVFLNYLLGLRALGFEPVFMEAATEWQPCCLDVPNNEMTSDPSYGIAYLERALDAVGLAGTRWWYRDDDTDHGMSRDEAIATLSESAVLLNLSASCSAPEFLRAPRRVLIDADAPFTQIRLADGDEDWQETIDGFDVVATYGINLAEGRTTFPDGGRRWLGVVPPIHVPSWPSSPVPIDGAWTTVTSWSSYGSRWWDLEEYRQKEPVFQALRDLPSMVDIPLELAITADAPRGQFERRGWRVVEPRDVTRTPEAFASYVRGSRGELCVTKEAYVKAQTGALNERTLAYLATGRPVACLDTGLGWLPTGEGLLPFSDSAGAARAIASAEAEIDRHSAAARDLVERHFSAEAVLSDLLRAADIPLPVTSP